MLYLNRNLGSDPASAQTSDYIINSILIPRFDPVWQTLSGDVHAATKQILQTVLAGTAVSLQALADQLISMLPSIIVTNILGDINQWCRGDSETGDLCDFMRTLASRQAAFAAVPPTYTVPTQQPICPSGQFFQNPITGELTCVQPTPTTILETPSNSVCTQDVQQCPDGSYVGRDPANNCQFRACPQLPPGPAQVATGDGAGSSPPQIVYSGGGGSSYQPTSSPAASSSDSFPWWILAVGAALFVMSDRRRRA